MTTAASSPSIFNSPPGQMEPPSPTQLAREVEDLRKDLHLLAGESENDDFADKLRDVFEKCDRQRIHLLSNFFISSADGAFRLGRTTVDDDEQGLSLSTQIPGPDVPSTSTKVELSAEVMSQMEDLRAGLICLYGGEGKIGQNMEKVHYLLGKFENDNQIALLEVLKSYIWGAMKIRMRVFGSGPLSSSAPNDDESNPTEAGGNGDSLERARLLGTFQQLFWMLMANRVTILGLQRKEAQHEKTLESLRQLNNHAMERLRTSNDALKTAHNNILIHQEREKLLWEHINKWDDEFDRIDAQRNLVPFPQNVNDWLRERNLPTLGEVARMHEDSEALDIQTRNMLDRGRQIDQRFDQQMAHLESRIESLRNDIENSPGSIPGPESNGNGTIRHSRSPNGSSNGRFSPSNGHAPSSNSQVPSSNGLSISPDGRSPTTQSNGAPPSSSSRLASPQNNQPSSQNGHSNSENGHAESHQNGRSD